MTGWTLPDRDILRRIIFQLQHPDWHVRALGTGGSADRRWHASNGTANLAASSLAALLDELDWFHATSAGRDIHRPAGTCPPERPALRENRGPGPVCSSGRIEPGAMQPQPGSVLPFRRRADTGSVRLTDPTARPRPPSTC